MIYPKYQNGKLVPNFTYEILFTLDTEYPWIDWFSGTLVSPDVAIIGESEDDKPKQYIFSSPHLQGLSPGDVLSRAKKLVALLSGAIFVTQPSLLNAPICISEGWYWDESIRSRVYIGSMTGNAREFPEEINEFSYQAWPFRQPLSQEGKLIFLCHTDEVVWSILTILGHNGLTYASLYSVLDCLKGAGYSEDQIAGLAGVSKANLKRFTATANNFGVLGVGARHGNLNWKTPTDPPLSLQESSSLVLNAAKRFLAQRVAGSFDKLWIAAGGQPF